MQDSTAFSGLTPGSYYVMADMRETWTVVENGIERVMGYAQDVLSRHDRLHRRAARDRRRRRGGEQHRFRAHSRTRRDGHRHGLRLTGPPG